MIRLYQALIYATVVMSLSGCTHLFFQPQKHVYYTPDQFNIEYQDILIHQPDQNRLHGWLMKPQKQCIGTVIFFHGNAENISTHFQNVVWLLNEGYQVALFDYRGYGQSDGVPEVAGAMNDILVTSRYSIDNYSKGLPVFVFGQSLGGALSITAFAHAPELANRVDGFIFEASFSSYQTIAQQSLGEFWLTWLFQYPLSWTAITEFDPELHIKKITKPILIIHSKDDQIIPFEHAEKLHRESPNSQLFVTVGPHINSSKNRQYRRELLAFLKQQTGEDSN